MVKAFWKYRKQAVNEHGIHSPFVFEFYNEVVKKIKDVDDHKIQQLRKSLSKDRREIEITDLGVGSKKSNNPKKRISEMARMAPVSAKYGKLLQRIVEHYKIENSLELGTSLGL